jgi:hypothetical protein
MTSEIRELLHAAADADASGVGARAAMQRGLQLRWWRRALVGLPIAVAAAVLLAVVLPRVGSFVDAERISPARPGRTHNAPLEEHDTRSDPQRAPASNEPEEEPAIGIAPRSPGTKLAPVQPSAGCDPLIEDYARDTSDSSIDILRSSISYRSSTNTLTFTHALRDIKPDTRAGEGPFYDLRFTLDDVEYSAGAHTTAAGEDEFSVMEPAHRAPLGTSSAAVDPNARPATGLIDRQRNTVVVHVQLDEFNEAEKAAAPLENRPVRKELKVGSTLTQIQLITYPRGSSWSMTSHEVDYGLTECDYVISG